MTCPSISTAIPPDSGQYNLAGEKARVHRAFFCLNPLDQRLLRGWINTQYLELFSEEREFLKRQFHIGVIGMTFNVGIELSGCERTAQVDSFRALSC